MTPTAQHPDPARHEPPLLAVRDLGVAFPRGGGQLHAVRDVSFDIHRGETLGLVGESGSGKSLTAFAVIGLVPPPGRVVGGSVRLEGRDLARLPEREMCAVRGRRIGFIFQEPMTALDPVHTIGAQIAEALSVHGLARGREAARARGHAARRRLDARPGTGGARVSAPALGRHAPARR